MEATSERRINRTVELAKHAKACGRCLGALTGIAIGVLVYGRRYDEPGALCRDGVAIVDDLKAQR